MVWTGDANQKRQTRFTHDASDLVQAKVKCNVKVRPGMHGARKSKTQAIFTYAASDFMRARANCQWKVGLVLWEKRKPETQARLGHICWFEFVVGSRPCSERFYSGHSGFPLSSKANISKFQFDFGGVLS